MAKRKRKSTKKSTRRTTKKSTKRRASSNKVSRLIDSSRGEGELLMNLRHEFDFEDVDTRNIKKSLKDFLEKNN